MFKLYTCIGFVFIQINFNGTLYSIQGNENSSKKVSFTGPALHPFLV